MTDDFDGDVRSLLAPTIGADEAFVPSIAVEQTGPLTDGVSSVDFGTRTVGVPNFTSPVFKITNTGTADLTIQNINVDGTNAGDFTVGLLQIGGTPALPFTLAPGANKTFFVTFVPAAIGARSAALHIASNVNGTKNPFDIALAGTGQTVFQAWMAAHGVAGDPNALGTNGVKNLLNFAFDMNPLAGFSGGLVFNGTLGMGGAIGTTGLPVPWSDVNGNGADIRALFIRRKDAAAAGLTYTVQFTADLATWEDSAVLPTVLADDGTNQIVSVPFPATVGGNPTRFFRLGVSIAP